MLRSDTLQRPSARSQECLPLHFPGKLLLETGSGPNPGRPFLLHNKTAENSLSVRATLRGFVVRKIGGISPGSTGGGAYSSSSKASPPSPVCICRWGLGKALCDPKGRKEMPENGKTMKLIRARLAAQLPPPHNNTESEARAKWHGPRFAWGMHPAGGVDQARPVQSSPWLSWV